MENIALTQIVRSPTNPRKHPGDLTDLIASVKQSGVLQPVLVRPLKGSKKFELVFGSRRYEAAKAADLGTIPCVARPMSDDEVIEAQIIENNQREDIHPLDEAAGFKVLLDRGFSAQDIGDKVGRPPAYVAQRMRLCDLSKKCEEALAKEDISLGVAMLMAKLGSHVDQDGALEVLKRFPGDAMATVAEAKEVIETEIMLSLKTAPFDTSAPDLVKAAGPCSACPKRTGNQGLLFEVDTSDDLCTDGVCFKAKAKAFFQIRTKTAKEEGLEVLSATQAKKVFPAWGTGHNDISGGLYQRLDAKVQDPRNFRSVGLKKIFKDAGKEPQIILAQNPHTGAAVELVRSKDVKAAEEALKRSKGKKGSSKVSPSEKRQATMDKRHREMQRLENQIRTEMITQAVSRISEAGTAKNLMVPLLEIMISGAVESVWSDIVKRVVERRQLPPIKSKGRYRAGHYETPAQLQLEAWAKTASETELLGLLFELLIMRGALSDFKKGGLATAAKLFKIDPKKIGDQLRVAAKAGKKPTKKPSKKPSKKVRKAKKGRK